MEKKSKVVKSKSSNAAANSALSKSERKNKKSKSNASFQSPVTKKRGVFVERKRKSLQKDESNITIENDWTSRKPVKDKKLFLPSVLTLLSKSSTGTQYQNPDVTKQKLNIKKPNRVETNVENVNKDITIEKKEKKKYKSRILNSDSYIAEQFEVLQSKKNFDDTPSMEHSDIGYIEEEDFENIKWSKFLPRLVQPDEDEIQLEKEKKLNHLLKEVTEGRTIKEKQVKIEQKPTTLKIDGRQDASLAVDFVEAMFSADDRSEYTAEPEFQSAVSSKTRFDVDKNNANKLNFGTEYSMNTSRYLQNYDGRNWNDENVIDNYRLSEPLFKPRKYRPGRAVANNKHSPQFSNYQSTAYVQIKNTRRRPSKRANKRNLMNLLKDQLSMDTEPLEEPQNLFQALKQIAKNKRKTQKTIQFDRSCVGDDNHKCVFKRRRVISSNTKTKSKHNEEYKQNNSMPLKSHGFDYGNNARFESTSEYEESNHSLEVFNPDYDSHWRRAYM